jgi:hypothetical protein
MLHATRQTRQTSPVALTHDLEYLRGLALVEESWRIHIEVLPICRRRYAALDVNYSSYRARVLLNAEYAFTRASAARAVTHELLELATIDMWRVQQATLGKIETPERGALEERARAVRDGYIERRLRAMPFWSEMDVPVLRESLNALCFSSLWKDSTASERRPRLAYCTDICGCWDTPAS